MQIIIRHSPEHFAAIAEIDVEHNRCLVESMRAFQKTHPGTILDTDPTWKKILERLDESRQQDLADLRGKIYDSYVGQ